MQVPVLVAANGGVTGLYQILKTIAPQHAILGADSDKKEVVYNLVIILSAHINLSVFRSRSTALI